MIFTAGWVLWSVFSVALCVSIMGLVWAMRWDGRFRR